MVVRLMKIRRAIISGIVLLASLYIVFIALIGYGLGQLFFGMFSWVATICALSALGSVFGAALCTGKSWCRLFFASLSLIAILCFGLEVVDYYRRLDIPGNNFAWDMKAPFLLSLLILLAANIYGWRSRPNTSLERALDR
jgi:hypothetical protein